jgi:hypothetical protein
LVVLAGQDQASRAAIVQVGLSILARIVLAPCAAVVAVQDGLWEENLQG